MLRSYDVASVNIPFSHYHHCHHQFQNNASSESQIKFEKARSLLTKLFIIDQLIHSVNICLNFPLHEYIGPSVILYHDTLYSLKSVFNW